jgi:hypothetical protein
MATGRSLHVGPKGHISADAQGHEGGMGPGAGRSSQFGGGGGGFGGRGSPACGQGGGGGGGAYGLAIAPSDLGYCVGVGALASVHKNCSRQSDDDLGSGGGHGYVQVNIYRCICSNTPRE